VGPREGCDLMASETDLKMEIAISRMLRAGVSVAAVVVLVGWIFYLWQAHGVEPDYRHFHGVRAGLRRRSSPRQSQHHPLGHSASDRNPDHACRLLRL
jgi:hypothetical protein